jgi:Tfp pilus assembly protein PilE
MKGNSDKGFSLIALPIGVAFIGIIAAIPHWLTNAARAENG